MLNKAIDQGIPAVLLIGSHWSWDQAQLARYTRGDATAVTTYSAIFNVNSCLADAQTLVFDDAHAVERFVAEAWAMSVGRDNDAYEQLFDAFGGAVEPSLVARMVAHRHCGLGTVGNEAVVSQSAGPRIWARLPQSTISTLTG